MKSMAIPPHKLESHLILCVVAISSKRKNSSKGYSSSYLLRILTDTDDEIRQDIRRGNSPQNIVNVSYITRVASIAREGTFQNNETGADARKASASVRRRLVGQQFNKESNVTISRKLLFDVLSLDTNTLRPRQDFAAESQRVSMRAVVTWHQHHTRGTKWKRSF